MKFLIGILLLVNIGMLVWIFNGGRERQPVDRTAIYNHSVRPEMRIRLLSEEKQLAYLADKPATQNNSPQPAPDLSPTATVKMSPSADKAPQIVQAEAEKPEVQQAPVASEKEPQRQERPVTPATEAVADKPAESAVEKSPTVSADFLVSHCFTMGPFAEKKAANNVTTLLAGEGIHATRRETSQRESVGYWVYLPPFSSRKQARNMENLLTQKGVKDFLVIPGGVMENAISLGVFSRRSSASRRVAELQDNGINALIKQNFDTTVLYWLDFTSPSDTPIPAATLEKLKQNQNGIGMIQHECE